MSSLNPQAPKEKYHGKLKKTFTLLWDANLPFPVSCRCLTAWRDPGNHRCCRGWRGWPFWAEQKWASLKISKIFIKLNEDGPVGSSNGKYFLLKKNIHNFLLEAVLKNLWRKFEKWDEVSSSTVKLGTPYVCMDPATYCWKKGDICQFWIFPCKRVCSQSSPMVEFLQKLEGKITRLAPGWLPR